MPIGKILTIVLGLADYVKDLLDAIPTDELTDNQRAALRAKRDELNERWDALAPAGE